MPILLSNDEVSRHQLQGYSVFVWAQDHPHPPHFHVRKGDRYSTWHLHSLDCMHSGGFSSSELRQQRKLLQQFHEHVRRTWHDHWQGQ
jgi:hypothetical protein